MECICHTLPLLCFCFFRAVIVNYFHFSHIHISLFSVVFVYLLFINFTVLNMSVFTGHNDFMLVFICI